MGYQPWQPNLALLLAACALTQGCVGVGVGWTKTSTCRNPSLEEMGGLEKAYDHCGGGTNLTACTPAWLEKSLGKPNSVKRTGPGRIDEVWTYKSELNWNGAILFVLIPIPLELPIGRECIRFTVRDGQVVEIRQRSTQMAGGIVGYSIGPCGITPFGVRSLD